VTSLEVGQALELAQLLLLGRAGQLDDRVLAVVLTLLAETC